MSLDTDLSLAPYFDDFDESKQFNRILFKPGRAVQARELTQLQTILQNQVERFGSNTYKEGTIINGINFTERNDLFYVKLNDQDNLIDPSIYDPTSNTTFFVIGDTNGLKAEIFSTSNGFETRDPDLKTFYIKYINTVQVSDTDVKQFEAGEVLRIVDENDVAIAEPDGTDPMTVTVASVSNTVGKSFGISVSEGVIYQKGFFILVANQLTIVSKYTNQPDDVSIGFDVQESVVTSAKDSSLLDNAQGFNNVNAPGADRLKLLPILTSVQTSAVPEGFFTLIRYENGLPVTIRDVTQFNSIATELARRTFEESGNYVVRGLNLTLEKDNTNNEITYAAIAPGKAYVFGYEVNNISKRYFQLEPSTDTQTSSNQSVGINYGNYFEFVWSSATIDGNTVSNDVLDNFVLDGTRYDLLDDGNSVIGSCSVRNVVPGVANTTLGRIYVYGIEKDVGEEDTAIAKISNTPVVGNLKSVNEGTLVFPSGKQDLVTTSNVVFTRRVRAATTGGNSIVISNTSELTPLTRNVFAVDATNNLISCSTVQSSNSITVTPSANDAAFIYYDAIDNSIEEDDITQVDMFVKSTFANDIAYIGVPNAVQLLSVIDKNGAGEDITSRFRLVNNAKDGFYDISYIQLKSGQTAPANNSLQIKATVFRRTSLFGGSYLDINSYNNADRSLVRKYTTKNGKQLDLLSSYDFRPYAVPWVSYSVTAGGAETASAVDLEVAGDIVPATQGFITSTQTYYLSRIDSIAIDAGGNFNIINGGPSEFPTKPKVKNAFVIGEVFVPGNTLNVSGDNSVKIETRVVRGYTMKDIGKLDRQVERLTEVVSLNLLERKTNDLFIPDENGLNRFKNGILVDDFKNFQIADMRNPEFNAGIDKGYRVATPSVIQFPIDMKVANTTNADSYKDTVTIANTGTFPVLFNQPFATASRNVVSQFYSYRGKASLSPQFDSSHDVVQNPAINLELDLASPILDLVNNIQDFIPLTTTDVSRTGTNQVEPIGNVLQLVSTLTETVERNELATNVVGSTQDIGTFVTDIAFSPYVRSREVKVLITGLRPNTRHYFFFDEEDVNEFVSPGTVVSLNNVGGVLQFDVDDVQPTGQAAGSVVRTDANGILAAIFRIPEGRFFTGRLNLEVGDVSTYSTLISGGTSYARVSYHGYNFSLGQADLTATTRTADIDTTTRVTTTQTTTRRFLGIVNDNQREGGGGGGGGEDPLAQTFYIKRGSGNGSGSVYLKDVQVFFQSKSSINGITLELREVLNGYPSNDILPFSRVHLDPTQIATSADGSSATTIEFPNPVKCDVEKEYAFVLIPDGNDPNYIVYTSKVGGVDLSTGSNVTQDWGDGVLFASTNNRAWTAYQDEDVKFRIRRLQFDTDPATVNLIPNDVEFFTIANTVGDFQADELVYNLQSDVAYSGVGISGRSVTIPTGSVSFNVGDYVLLAQGSVNFLSSITNIDSNSSVTTISMRGPSNLDETGTVATTATLAIAGRVSYFNNRRPDRLYLSESSARATRFFEATDTLVGYRSGATAKITSVDDIPISYFQPLLFLDETIGVSSTLALYDGITLDKTIPFDNNVYVLSNSRVIESTSNVLEGSSTQDFVIRLTLDNNDNDAVSPIFDASISILNVYQYTITDTESSTSKYISKEVALQNDMNAVGLKVLLAGFRPPGTYIDVYARFLRDNNVEVWTDWVQLDNATSELYSSGVNPRDYRDFTYNLGDETNEYSSFQLKIVFRHAISAELTDTNLSVTPNLHLFPHVFDYRAIALT